MWNSLLQGLANYEQTQSRHSDEVHEFGHLQNNFDHVFFNL